MSENNQISAVSIYSALAKAQGKFKTPTLNRIAKIKNASGALLYETHYADLQEIISCIKEPLAENNLSFTQTVDFITTPVQFWALRLTLRHADGNCIDSILPLKVDQSPQQLGGALTYFKRYQLSAFFGLAADFDDDGNAAAGTGNTYEKQSKPAAKKETPPTQPAIKPENKAPQQVPGNFVFPKGFPIAEVVGKKISEFSSHKLGEIQVFCEVEAQNAADNVKKRESFLKIVNIIDSFVKTAVR